jgi:hypothetical protein
VLATVWAALHDHPEARLKRQLWDRLLSTVYGTEVGDDGLFLQHTYLTIVAKTIAVRVLDLPAVDAEAILSGQALAEAGIHGAVESDFFDWVLLHEQGREVVLRTARQTARFRLHDVQADVLKALYESLIDPAQRHDLGEYYTPDWLAAKLLARAVPEPLTQRVLDPSYGGRLLHPTAPRHSRRSHGKRHRRTDRPAGNAPPGRTNRRCLIHAPSLFGQTAPVVQTIAPRTPWSDGIAKP